MKAKILSPVRHDGKEYSEGDVVEMSKEQAARLVSLGIAKICDDSAEDKTKENKTEDGNQGRQGDDPRDPELMTKDELKQELSLLGIAYSSNASKGQLLELYLDAKETPNEF
jgi:hypothetical protein